MRSALVVLLMLTLVVPAVAGESDDSGTINIMRPEPEHTGGEHRHANKARGHRAADERKGFGVKEDTRRGSAGAVYPTPLPAPQPPLPVPHQQVVTPQPVVPPSLFVPQTGRTLPNLPTVAPSGPNGTETYQDRALRCAHQAGVYGQAAGDRSSYINSCINQ